MRIQSRRTLSLFAAAITMAFASAAQAYDYTVTLFGQLSQPGGQQIAYDVTNSGVVVGTAVAPGGFLQQPFRSAGGVTTFWTSDANTNNGSGLLRAANSSGMAVGTIGGAPLLWDGTDIRVIAMPRGATNGIAYAVNDSGIAAGSFSANNQSFAATWDTALSDPVLRPLVGLDPDAPFGGQSSIGLGITASGVVVGTSVNGAGFSRPVVWSPTGAISELSTGAYAAGGIQATTADGSFMAGFVDAGIATRAAVWQNGQLTVLDASLAETGLAAFAINASGTAVGFYNNLNGRAALWSGGQMFDLTSLVDPASLPAGSYLSMARGINDSGSIVGTLRSSMGASQAFLLTPVTAVPEPHQALLLLAGLGVIFGRRAWSRAARN